MPEKEYDSRLSSTEKSVAELTVAVRGLTETVKQDRDADLISRRELRDDIQKLSGILTTTLQSSGKLNWPLGVSMVSEARSWLTSGGKVFWAILIAGNALLYLPTWREIGRVEQSSKDTTTTLLAPIKADIARAEIDSVKRHELQEAEISDLNKTTQRLNSTTVKLVTNQSEVTKQFHEVKNDYNTKFDWVVDKLNCAVKVVSATLKIDMPLDTAPIPHIPMGEFKTVDTIPDSK